MAVIDAHASERHYLDHIWPVWDALGRPGTFTVGRGVARWLHDRGHPAACAVEVQTRPGGSGPVLVASWQDYRAARGRPVVMVNHGAGQTYDGDPATSRHPSYSGGRERERVILNVCPGPLDQARCVEAQPDVPAIAVGCPKLDPWLQARKLRRSSLLQGPRSKDRRPTVAVSWHADVPLCPESRWAYPHYQHALPVLAARWRLLGHSHPRMWPLMRRVYARLGVEATPDFGEVLDRADLYVVDNSSTAYEAAAVGIPVLLLNTPTYRRDIHHGLRFWDLIPGLQCDRPDDLPDLIETALSDPAEARGLRDRAVTAVYAALDGLSTPRAAAAIRETLRWHTRSAPASSSTTCGSTGSRTTTRGTRTGSSASGSRTPAPRG